MNELKDVEGVRDCCKDEANLRVVESKATLTTRQCVICGAKHHELTAEPFVINSRFGDGTPGD